MDQIRNGWFSEISEFWPGNSFSLQVEEVLHHEKSEYQDILVFKSKTFGNVLVLDGVIQATERDEFAYQEMITHVPMFGHPNPKKVLVVGGGDGGVLREVVKHDCVESVTLCEIDKGVIEASRRFLPKMAVGFDHPKVNLFIGDGLEFMRKHKGEFDVIITDSSDPIGPAQGLFERAYYELLNEALAPGGIVCSQAESLWLHLATVKGLTTFCKEIFPHVEYAYTSIPSYPGGSIGLLICGTKNSSKTPVRPITPEIIEKMQYYNEAVHKASFVLPQFAVKELNI
ncbi:spermidine synthase [Heterostelium album PN500]|uniref:Spermidine synthase n=1 Tax=Heterostelium pallidum (strain ATCC 26659 / Pp 5 / PN500) TaxID=670386 RepID=D3BHT0_HETP5|nr:spermidine synthase [Heterostelium album PN500]EFA78830.1 spermidine synthase [Heterostelium album PN500]|eukprot:XP_020430954.1 spermidine synthase [Heterostelium album PN500]